MNTKEQVIENLKNWIKKTSVISYDKEIGFNCWDKEIKVDTRNQAPTDGRLVAFNDIYLIAKECLDENKPMYLSID